jgi:hypothetical protein
MQEIITVTQANLCFSYFIVAELQYREKQNFDMNRARWIFTWTISQTPEAQDLPITRARIPRGWYQSSSRVITRTRKGTWIMKGGRKSYIPGRIRDHARTLAHWRQARTGLALEGEKWRWESWTELFSCCSSPLGGATINTRQRDREEATTTCVWWNHALAMRRDFAEHAIAIGGVNFWLDF